MTDKFIHISFEEVKKNKECLPWIAVEFRYSNKEVRLVHPIVYTGTHNNQFLSFVVPDKFFASGSIPSFAWAITTHPLDTKALLQYFLHDYLYVSELYSRKTADILLKDWNDIFLSEFKEGIIYRATRWFGGIFKKKNKEKKE